MQQTLWHMLCDVWAVVKGVLLVGLPTALLLTHVWYEYRITKLGYAITRETRRHERLLDAHRKLTVEATVLKRERRLAPTLRRRYGLERIEPDQVVDVAPPNRSASPSEENDERDGE